MPILARPHAGVKPLVALAQHGYIDKHAILRVNPAAVYHIINVAACHLVAVVRVYVQQVRPVCHDLVVRRGGHVGAAAAGVDVLGGVEVGGQPGHGGVGELDVNVVVPGHGLGVPPPAEEGAVGEPRLGAVGGHGGEVAPDEAAEDVLVLLVGDGAGKEARVVVEEGEGAAGLGEVLCRQPAGGEGAAGGEGREQEDEGDGGHGLDGRSHGEESCMAGEPAIVAVKAINV